MPRCHANTMGAFRLVVCVAIFASFGYGAVLHQSPGKGGRRVSYEGVVEEYLEALNMVEEEIAEFYQHAPPDVPPDPHTEAQELLRRLRQELYDAGLTEGELQDLLESDDVLQNETSTFIPETLPPTTLAPTTTPFYIENITSYSENTTSYSEDTTAAEESPNVRKKRTIEKSDTYRWDKGVIPYLYTDTVNNDGRIEIVRAMHTYERFTCIRYVPWWKNEAGITVNQNMSLGHEGHLKFVARGGCWSFQGNHRGTKGQDISCCGTTNCIHELGHALGMFHEQQSPNPDRNWWIRINDEYVSKSGKPWYNTRGGLSYGYDLSSYMHYASWMFSANSGRTFSILLPKVREHNSYYYMMYEVSVAHGCAELFCADDTRVCENDGYLTLVDGVCACRCVEGLDPENNCASVYKIDFPDLTFPNGQYALPQANTGCPDSSFTSGTRIQYNEVDDCYTKSGKYAVYDGDVATTKGGITCQEWGSQTPHKHDHGTDLPGNTCRDPDGSGFPWCYTVDENKRWDKCGVSPCGGRHSVSTSYDLYGGVEGNKVEQGFCVSSSGNDGNSKWQPGNYCIYRKGGTCPEGFTEGFVQYDDNPTTENANSFTGDLPDGMFDNNTRLEFCCRRDGFSRDELFLPSREPVVLMKHPKQSCQKIRGMHVSEQSLSIDNAQGGSKEIGGWVPVTDGNFNSYKTTFCYYTPAFIDCGEVVELTPENPTFAFSSPHGPELQCYWLIKAPQGQRLTLSFNSFNIEGTPGKCKDEVEVRYGRIGQPGITYCGDSLDETIFSYNNTIYVRMSMYGDTSSAFSATANLIVDEELCYNVSDRGTSYGGSVNYTLNFQPCLPWRDMGHCTDNPYNNEIANTMLDGNFCRNPNYDTAIQPWCYTQSEFCVRQYCDVCQLGNRYDKLDNCATLKAEGFCSSKPEDALENCAETCKADELSTPPPASEVTCGPPPSVIDGDLQDFDPSVTCYQVGARVTYQCKYQYTYKDRVCLSTGEWSQLGFVCDDCPDGWHLNLETRSCYSFFQESVTYPQAVGLCENQNAFLTTAENQQENDFIRGIASGNFWIGITDEAEEGKWLWTDGREANWTNWDTSQPDNWGSGEDCAFQRDSGKWNDVYCTYYSYSYVCKTPMLEIEDCLDFWDECEELFSFNPKICTEYTDFSRRTCPRTCGVCHRDWTPPCPVTSPTSNATVDSNEDYISRGEYVTYTCREGTVPISGVSLRGCLDSGLLSGEELVCGQGCPDGWTYNEDNKHCYRHFSGSKNYNDAQAECQSFSGQVTPSFTSDLVTPRTNEENSFIHQLKNDAGDTGSIYIGLDDKETEGTFQWVTGDTNLIWSNWNSGEPNDHGGNEDCAVMLNSVKWNDAPCWYKYAFVCEATM